MGKKHKPLCKWDKDDIKDKFDKLKEIVRDPRYICRKCGHVAHEEDYLCKPEKL